MGNVRTNQDEKLLENMVLIRVMRLNVAVNGIATGLVLGLGLFAATLFLLIKGGPVVGPHLGLLGQYLPGYDVTLLGSFIGLAWGFVIGFLIGAFVALIYNRIAGWREASASRQQPR
jgi:hypothetical protein